MPQPNPPFEIVQCLTGPHAGKVGFHHPFYGADSFINFCNSDRSSTYGQDVKYRVIISTSDLLALINSIVQELPAVAPPERPAPPHDAPQGWVPVTIPADSIPAPQFVLESVPPRPTAVYADIDAMNVQRVQEHIESNPIGTRGLSLAELLTAVIRPTP